MLEFFQFNEPNVWAVAIGAVLIGFFSGFSGVFLVLDRKSLLGDAISHSLLPGICLAYLIHQSKSPYVLLIGASVSGLLSTYFVDLISQCSKLKRDAALAISLSFFFAIGIMLLSYIQHNFPANQAGLESYLFGKAAAIKESDLLMILPVGSASVLFLLLFLKEYRIILFSETHARTTGMNVDFFRFMLSFITVLVISIGIQIAGVVLMAALILAPVTIARFYTHRLSLILILSASIGAFSGLFGSAISYVENGMPTGPWIVLILFFLAIMSVAISKMRATK